MPQDKEPAAEASADNPVASFLERPLAERHRVWFSDPGKRGRNLMIGNGHLGAMFDANTKTAGISLNVDSMWKGDEKRMGAYQAFARMAFHLGHERSDVTNYHCQLNYRTGEFTLTYTHKGVNYRQEAFCSYPRGLLAVRYSADSPGVYSGLVELSAMHKSRVSDLADGIEFAGKLSNQHRFKGVMRVKVEGGKLSPAPEESGTRVKKWRRYTATMPYRSLRVEKADSVTLYFAGDTDYSFDAAKQFFGPDPAEKIAPRLANLAAMSFEEMQRESAEDVASLFDRCTIDLATAVPEAEDLPIDERRAAYGKWEGGSDTGLEMLHFDAAKYLMIASSRKGSLPANLQGVWNDSNWPAWTSDYHADINIQMNYWFVEPANLAECAVPLFDYIESQIPVRRKVARQIYGEKTRGWSVHYMNNIFGGDAYANMPAGSAWYAWHFAEHFKFGQDVGFLKQRGYPLLKELSEHWQDLLIERPDGKLVTPKTMSPEHKPEQYAISQDLQIVHNLLSDYAQASTRLAADTAFRDTVLDMRERLIAPQMGRWGQLQEWEVDRDSRFCTHRHIQHLFAAFPGSDITPRKAPELTQAGIRSLEARGPGSTGWSQAWRASIFARLNKPALVYRQIRSLVTGRGFHDNLMWHGKQQIDAPCGYASGVCEALLQSHEALDDRDERFLVHLLPALPTAWPHGKVKGLRARGGFEVDMEWQDGALTRAWIKGVSNAEPACALRYADKTYVLEVPRNETIEFVPGND